MLSSIRLGNFVNNSETTKLLQYIPHTKTTHARQQFHFLTDLTVRGKAALTSLGVEFVALPAVSEMRS